MAIRNKRKRKLFTYREKKAYWIGYGYNKGQQENIEDIVVDMNEKEVRSFANGMNEISKKKSK